MAIAFVGLGNMGGPMAANLVKAQQTGRGFDLDAAACEAARSAGVAVAGSLAEAASDADMVITMLPMAQHAIAVWTELLPKLKAGTLLIDCSTIDVESARKLHVMAQSAGCLALDAPVSGGVVGAKAATLTIMVGGGTETFAKADPVLKMMAKRTVHCGDAGAGQAAKICNNMILGISTIAVAEAFVLAEKLGLSHQALFDVASTSSGQCWVLTTNCPVPGPVPTSAANNGFKPGFAGALMLKDLRLSQDAAQASGATTPLGAAATQIFASFAEADGAGLDYSGVINFVRKQSQD